MSKREATLFAAQGVDVDAPRAKRQKTGAATAQTAAHATGTGDVAATNGSGSVVGESGKPGEDPEQVKERGLKLLQTIKDAKDKEGRQMSTDFLRLPSKRQYPDYYEQIKRPIALDDIKRRLEGGGYAFFDELKGDFELCFKNAKKYNMKESQIWQDAKYLHKLVTKESSKLTGIPAGDDEEADGNADAGSDTEEGKRKKAPNMSRLLKTRLQKLVDRTDDDGRVVSAEFMELPNKKQWPIYYKLIKKPQCFENIFKHLKRKEYHTPTDFANDVELVFSNALEFNQEHTQIWEDAVVLRDYFRQLMSDLPAPFTIPAYASSNHSTKVKLKIPIATQLPVVNQPSTSTPALVPPTASPRPRVAVPVSVTSLPSPSATSPAAFTSVLSPPTVPQAAPQMANGALTIPPIPSAVARHMTPASSMALPGLPNHPQSGYPAGYTQPYMSSAYRPPVASNSLPNSNSINPTRPYTQPITPAQAPILTTQRSQSQVPVAKSPTPPETSRPLRYVSIVTKPTGRKLDLSYREGVKTWAVRLSSSETSVRVSEVKFLEDTDEHSDSEEKPRTEVERHEEEEEEEHEEEQDKPTKRGRGRPKKSVQGSPKGKGKARAKSQPPEDELQIRLNGVVITSTDDGVWDTDLSGGLNVVEIGVKGGMTWRAYLDRIATA